MASARAYRKALPLEVCRSEIEKNIGIMYDPKIAEAALKNWEELTSEYIKDDAADICYDAKAEI